ncbi:hypothetical protein CPC08DRAFT_717218 [Agrocybe pediades]|nr:hypothetical protein CPC08DRAFT_717218 [Agrocybe pediades]
MVLKPTGNSSKRSAKSENTPPQANDARPSTPIKTFANRLQTHLIERRRARTSGSSPSNPSPYSAAKFKMQQSRRRRVKGTKASDPFKFKVTQPKVGLGDSSKASGQKMVNVSVPRVLPRPDYKEINRDVLSAIDPSCVESMVDFLRESLESIYPEFLQSLADAKISSPKDKLLDTLPVAVTDQTLILPSHILAIYPQSAPSSTPSTSTGGAQPPRTKVTLYAIHSLVLAAHCANLPVPPTPVPPPASVEGGKQVVDIKVWSLCLPSPETYPQLSTYLYTKKVRTLMNTILPCPPPPSILNESDDSDSDFDSEDSKPQPPANNQVLWAYAMYLARTFTPSALLRGVRNVHGFWSNVCALGVFDARLWDVVDVMWQAITTALALATRDVELARIVTPQQAQSAVA